MFSYCAPPASRPLPRRTARSMFSFGTELFFAFWIASYRVGFPAGSPPPVRAATSTFLISLANSLPRLASTTAFLCLVVAHFEWPLIAQPACEPASRQVPHHLAEIRMHPSVPGQFGVEGRGQQVPLANYNDPTGEHTPADSAK